MRARAANSAGGANTRSSWRIDSTSFSCMALSSLLRSVSPQEPVHDLDGLALVAPAEQVQVIEDVIKIVYVPSSARSRRQRPHGVVRDIKLLRESPEEVRHR